MKNYKYPKSKKLIKQLRPFYKEYQIIENIWRQEVYKLEKKISKATKIPEIEFSFVDNDCAGIGNVERTMEIIHSHELEA